MLIFSRVQVIYITLSFLLCSESYVIRRAFYKHIVMCRAYSPRGYCTREYFPVCATNGRTYFNKCTFCLAYRENGGSFTMSHFGTCRDMD
ncbi:ovomucoid-like [Apodemus sylvaticus]|uniref:ovomucoid-like n=1 Tax=Apodemus sylvaticus TaxID=10129 RepID=UPI0022441DB0|nr:ovomucoid-like [Apodemus sylvaticus]